MKARVEIEERRRSEGMSERKSHKVRHSLQSRCRLYLGLSISISVTETAGRQGTEKRISGMPFMLAPFDLLLAFGSKGEVGEAMQSKQLRREWGAVLTTSLYSSYTSSLIHPTTTTKPRPPSSTSKTSDGPRSMGITIVTDTKHTSQALVKWCSYNTRQQLATGQWWQCHHRHVIQVLLIHIQATMSQFV